MGRGAGSFTAPPSSATNLTIEGTGAGDGFNGMGATTQALNWTAPSGLTLRNLTFENYKPNGAAAVVLQAPTGILPVIDHDSFVNNQDTGAEPAGAGLAIDATDATCSYTGSLTISSSLFSSNKLVATDSTFVSGAGATGAGASVAFQCSSSHTASLAIFGNVFEQNSIQTAGTAAAGGGLYLADDSAHVVGEKATSSGLDVTIHCAGTSAQTCSGTIKVITVETRLGNKVIAVASAAPKRRHRTVTVANHSYVLAGGATITVHLPLNGADRFLIRRFHMLPVLVVLTQVGQSKPISSRTLTIPAPKTKHRKH